MSFTKSLLIVFAVMMAVGSVSVSAYANDEGKACKADADCGHGEHCKDGHCHGE